MGVALRFGRGPAVVAAFVGVGLFDFFFVPPRFSFAVSDVQYLITFAVMLVVALVVGQLTAGLTVQARSALQREQRVHSLYEMSRDLSAALLPAQVAEIGARFLATEFGARSALLAADDEDRLRVLPGATADFDLAVRPVGLRPRRARWTWHRHLARQRLSHAAPEGPDAAAWVLALEPGSARVLAPEQRQLLETCASLLAISLERIHYIEVAQSSTVQIESERLRNSLLSAISHDLRTPLASLVGLADTLSLAPPPPPEQQLEILTAIRQSAQRMSAQVSNLLDMARLQAGAVQLNRAWQPVEEVVGSALAACGNLLAGRDIRVELPDGLPLLHLDAVLIERVLVNLLENASKYTPTGGAIEISAKLCDEYVALQVDDHGPGLPNGQEARVFEKFERGLRESSTPGVGLGLAICRAIVQAHGGTIEGHNRERDGAVLGAHFVLKLPRGIPPADLGTSPNESPTSP